MPFFHRTSPNLSSSAFNVLVLSHHPFAHHIVSSKPRDVTRAAVSSHHRLVAPAISSPPSRRHCLVTPPSRHHRLVTTVSSRHRLLAPPSRRTTVSSHHRLVAPPSRRTTVSSRCRLVPPPSRRAAVSSPPSRPTTISSRRRLVIPDHFTTLHRCGCAKLHQPRYRLHLSLSSRHVVPTSSRVVSSKKSRHHFAHHPETAVMPHFGVYHTLGETPLSFRFLSCHYFPPISSSSRKVS
jgi:hypothetical protein